MTAAVRRAEDFASGWRALLNLGARLDERLVAALDAGRVIVAVGRNSGHGRQARVHAAKDLRGAVTELAKSTGLDLSSLFPAESELVSLLELAPTQQTTGSDGRPLEHQYVILDHCRDFGVLFVLATGSGSKLTEDFEQPFVIRVAYEFRRVNGCLLVAKRNDRNGRQTWAMAPIWLTVEETNSFLFDEDGLRVFDSVASVLMFIKGISAQQQAKQMPTQTRREQQNRSGTEMVEGVVAYHGGVPIIPGFTTTWLLGTSGRREIRVMCLDAPQWHPPDGLVAEGLSEVRAEDGTRVDQVANVRFILSRLGRPDWPQNRMATELIARQCSSDALRALRRSAHATVDRQSTGKQVIQTILRNLDVYETGELTRRLNDDYAIHITGCVPTDGPWATAEDFERIRAWRRLHLDRANRGARMTMSGVAGTFGGTAMRLVKDSRSSGTRYAMVREDRYPTRRVAVRPGVLLSAATFAESIVEGLITAGEGVLRAALPEDLDDGDSAELTELRARERRAQASLAALQQQAQHLEAQVAAVGHDGAPVLSGALLARTNASYNRLVEQDLPPVEAELWSVQEAIADRTAQRPAVAGVSAALRLVASLRDPEDVTYRLLWKGVLHNLHFEIDSDGTTLTWHGWLRLGDDEHVVLVPFAGEHSIQRTRRKPKPLPRLEPNEWLAELASGTPWSEISPGRPVTRKELRAVRDAVAAMLGIVPKHHLFACDDPRILTCAVELLRAPGESDDAMAVGLAEPVGFIAEVRATLGLSRRGWRGRGDRMDVALHVLAAADSAANADRVMDLAGTASRGAVYTATRLLRLSDPRWTTARKRGYRFQCACGSHAAAPLVIPEPLGAVCLGCRRDAAGVVWPADPYDRYAAYPEMWAAHGFAFDTD